MIRSKHARVVLALAILALAVAGPVAAKKKKQSRDSGVACAILDAPLSVEEVAAAVDSALASVPGVVESVAFRTGHASDGSEVVFLAVTIRDAAGDLHPFYFDGETGAPLVPPTPTVAFNDAMTSAVLLVEDGSAGTAQVLSGKLVNEVIAPVYVFRIVSADDRVVVVAVDAQTGEVRVVEPWDDRSKRGKRGKVRCDDSDSDSDSDDADSDSDSDDSDSDSDDADSGDSDSDV